MPERWRIAVESTPIDWHKSVTFNGSGLAYNFIYLILTDVCVCVCAQPANFTFYLLPTGIIQPTKLWLATTKLWSNSGYLHTYKAIYTHTLTFLYISIRCATSASQKTHKFHKVAIQSINSDICNATRRNLGSATVSVFRLAN